MELVTLENPCIIAQYEASVDSGVTGLVAGGGGGGVGVAESNKSGASEALLFLFGDDGALLRDFILVETVRLYSS